MNQENKNCDDAKRVEARSHGLSDLEYDSILKIMGREPNHVELGIFSVMWSEHCSYKSSRLWLKTLPTEGAHVIQGPGENAGVIDIGDNQACIFKIESHNHPSFIEPYQGAATGVGGIMRDVFTMGARPIANLNALRFGDPNHPFTRRLVNGVIAGVGGYGNCFGVPTVGGECEFDAGYNGNILVNAMTIGLADQDKIFLSAAAGVGNPVVYVGARTGKDGIHGATMASAEFSDDNEAKRPTVQVGDPFKEKLLLEACLELMQADAIVAIQDMGAAGLTSSSVEMADKGQVGIELWLDQVPMREENTTPYELMLSESQERMLMVLKPEAEGLAREIFKKWDLDIAVIGRVCDHGRLDLMWYGDLAATIPVAPLVAESPIYNRPSEDATLWSASMPDVTPKHDQIDDLGDVMKRLLGSANLTSRHWIWQQYDYLIKGQTIVEPGGDAAVIGISDSGKALAVTVDSQPRYCMADPFEGGKQAVAESYRNIIAVGAKPMAVTNNLNFGNPERPAIMGQFVGCVQGIAEACEKLGTPVVSGNVSLYNETDGQAIPPTPVIGCVGLLKDRTKSMSIQFKKHNEDIILIGKKPSHLGQSRYMEVIEDNRVGPPPQVDLALEKKHGEFIHNLITELQLISACHDISCGGLMIALAEMAISPITGAIEAQGTKAMGADLSFESTVSSGFLFGEDQGCYIITTSDVDEILALAKEAKIDIMILGKTTAVGQLIFADGKSIDLSALNDAYQNGLSSFLDS